MTFTELEKIRKKIVKNYIIALAGSSFFSIMFILLKEYELIIFPPILSPIVGCVLSLNDFDIYKQNFNKIYKEHFIINALKKYFNNLVYEPTKGISLEAIRQAQIVDVGNLYSSRNYISGEYKSVEFAQADLYLGLEFGDPSEHRTLSIFDGRWLVFEFNKPFKSNVQVIEKNLRRIS